MEIKYNRPKDGAKTLATAGTAKTLGYPPAPSKCASGNASFATILSTASNLGLTQAATFSARTPKLGQSKPLCLIKAACSRKALFRPPARPQTAASYGNMYQKNTKQPTKLNVRVMAEANRFARPRSAARTLVERPRNLGHDGSSNPVSPMVNKFKQLRVHSNERQLRLCPSGKENVDTINNMHHANEQSKKLAVVSPKGEKRTGLGNDALEAYQLGRQIGKGAYAVVREVVRKTDNAKFAVKVYEKYRLMDPQRRRNVNREIQILQKLDHQNIVKLIETVDGTKQLCLVFELVRGGSLYSHIKSKDGRRLDESEARRVFKQILAGIKYCHTKGVSHRDIKLENLLLDERKNVKIIDFGFSTCAAPNAKLHMFCGTPSYMAPEIVSKRDYYGPPADIWALGVVLYAMLVGKFPFKGLTERDLYRSIARGVYAAPAHVSARARALIARMLQVDPSRRPSCEDIANDPFVCEGAGSSSSTALVFPGVGNVANAYATVTAGFTRDAVRY